MDGYLSFVLAFNEHVNDLEQEPDKEHDFDYVELLQESFVYPLQTYIKAATFEWIAEGIRCSFTTAKMSKSSAYPSEWLHNMFSVMPSMCVSNHTRSYNKKYLQDSLCKSCS